MKKAIRFAVCVCATACAAALLLFGCGGSSKKEAEADPPSDEIRWAEGRFGNLCYKYPEDMPEIEFSPRDGAEGAAYGISDEEGSFYGFTLEHMACEPGVYDELESEGFLKEYFPEHWEEYSIEELGDEDSGREIARYNGNPVFCRGIEDLSEAGDGFKNAEYALEYLILDEGNNTSSVYVVTVYEGDSFYPGTLEYFDTNFCRRLSFDNEASKAEDLAAEDNSPMEAEGTVYEPVSMVLGDLPQYEIPPYYITIVGAEFFRHDGKEAIRILYDVKNEDASYERAWEACEYFSFTATQDGESLTETWGYEANEKDDLGYDGSNPEVLIDYANYIFENEYSNNRRCIMRDGYSARAAEEYLCDWQGGPITLRITLPIYNYNLNFYAEDDPLMVELRDYCQKEVTFDPADMPCRVKDEEWLTPVEDPSWTKGLPEEGDIFADDEMYIGHVKLADAEFADVDGETHMMLHVEYTNNGTEDNSLFELLAIPVWKSGMADGFQHFWVMQDGVTLTMVETDLTKHGQSRIVQPGGTEEYVLEYIVRSDRPIEVEVNYPPFEGGLYEGKAAGKVYRQ